MDPAVAVTILAVVLIVAALAIFLIATILELRKVANGLDVVIQGVGEIAAKTAPVNGVLDAINTTLVAGRNLLEGLFLKKAGPYSAGLVESCFPGEGARFLQRVGRSGTVMDIGDEFPPGAATLAALVAATRGQPAPDPAPVAAPAAAAPAAAPPAAAAPAAPPPPAPAGRIVLRPRNLGPAEGGSPSEAPTAAGRVNVRGSRPWEGGSGSAPPPPPPPAPAPPAAPPADTGDGGRLNVRGSRPWES